jgi:uncharacterized membrane protein YeiB
MRGLFSFLFGASMLLVIEGAGAKGQSAASIHYRRMVWLLVFGLLHLYLVWFGDILASYALVGMIAWFFHGHSNRALIRWGIALLGVQLLIFTGLSAAAFMLREAATAPGAPAEAVAGWNDRTDWLRHRHSSLRLPRLDHRARRLQRADGVRRGDGCHRALPPADGVGHSGPDHPPHPPRRRAG